MGAGGGRRAEVPWEEGMRLSWAQGRQRSLRRGGASRPAGFGTVSNLSSEL